jgi:hypothetical protein
MQEGQVSKTSKEWRWNCLQLSRQKSSGYWTHGGNRNRRHTNMTCKNKHADLVQQPSWQMERLHESRQSA